MRVLAAARAARGAPLTAEDYPAVRAASDYVGLTSTTNENPMALQIHGYQIGGTGAWPPPVKITADLGAPMTDDEWAAKVASLAAAGRSVFAIPVVDGAVRQNVCLHAASSAYFDDLPDLHGIPNPIDAVEVGEWKEVQIENTGTRMRREFHVGHLRIPDLEDDETCGETVLRVDGVQDQDGSTWRHIKVLMRYEGEETIEVTRYPAVPRTARALDAARKVAVGLLTMVEQIEATEMSS
ncbi:hypothetical protein [Mycobacterium bohemicum]|uniref:hypothetical protein n=1 Tax=Mycobacterium bohemicum TaxID=56425 RepID=UPI0011125192|nr:hypothetical protein [Mycobacterium bohemicum]MCV6970090.1 hypothetical protein [Mycobacterium bohemicum]